MPHRTTDGVSKMKVEHNARLSVFGAIAAMTKPAALEDLRTKVAAAGHELPLAKTLDAFMRKQAAA